VPIDLRTLAPAPSDCSIARKALRIALETVIFADFRAPEIALGGNRGSPLKLVVLVLLTSSFIVPKCRRSVSLNAIARNAMVIEKRIRYVFIGSKA
jgi:hypothetical protein